MTQYVVKERFEETVHGTRTYTVEAESAADAWAKVEGGDIAPDSETHEVQDSRYDMISAFVVKP